MTTAVGSDAALDTLLLPILDGRLPWPESGALFLRARYGAALTRGYFPGLVCETGFRPEALSLQGAGFVLGGIERAPPPATARYGLVLMLPPRQREEARALMARAVAATAPGGRVIACVANAAGARSSEADLRKLAGPLETYSKNKCRVFWSAPLRGSIDPQLAAHWQQLDAVRPIGAGRYLSRPGIFAWDRIDPASALLAANLPGDLRGRAADLGCGFGYLSAQVLERCPGVAALDVFDAEQRAVDLARRNLAQYEARIAINYHWHDVTAGLAHQYDAIVSNPPFHLQQRADRPDVGRAFIEAAATALRPGGCLWLVANRHLPYEAALGASFGRVRIAAQQDGFKIIEAVKIPARTPLQRDRR